VRRFVDDEGRAWDVVLGRESWGALYALFVPAGPGGTQPVRQALLQAAGYDAAYAELMDADEARIADLFRKSTPKES
jgi:hypothetical protein